MSELLRQLQGPKSVLISQPLQLHLQLPDLPLQPIPKLRLLLNFYEVIIERHRRASTIVTSDRTIDEWVPLFDDPILAQSALDRLAHDALQLVIDGH